MVAVAQYDVVDVAYTQAVDVDVVGGHLAGEPSASLVELEHIAVAEDEDVLVFDAHRARQFGVEGKVAVFAMDWDEVARADEREDYLQLLLSGVATHVHVGDPIVEHPCAQPEQVIDRA